jgi:hypothetical protein
MSSNVNLKSYCTSDTERPRLLVLENFKKISKMLRTNFLSIEGRKGL